MATKRSKNKNPKPLTKLFRQFHRAMSKAEIWLAVYWGVIIAATMLFVFGILTPVIGGFLGVVLLTTVQLYLGRK